VVVLGAVDVEGAVDHSAQPKQHLLEDRLTIHEHGHGLAHAPIGKEGTAHVPTDVGVAGQEVFEFLEMFFKPLGLGLSDPLDGTQSHEVQAALFENLERHRGIADDLEDKAMEIGLLSPVVVIPDEDDFFAGFPMHQSVGSGTNRLASNGMLVKVVTFLEPVRGNDGDAATKLEGLEVGNPIAIAHGIIVQDLEALDVLVVVPKVGGIDLGVLDSFEREKDIAGGERLAILPANILLEMEDVLQVIVRDLPRVCQHRHQFQGCFVPLEE